MSVFTSLVRGWFFPFALAAAIFPVTLGLYGGSAEHWADKDKPQPSWPGPEGSPLPFQSHEQVLEFLRKSKVAASREIGSGTNDTRQLTLRGKPGTKARPKGQAATTLTVSAGQAASSASARDAADGPLEVHAVFRDVDIEINRTTQVSGRFVTKFRDNFVYEVAAYKLSRLLGIDQIPPTVLRKFERRQGSVQLWIYDAFSETKRREEGLQPPDDHLWTRQIQTKLLFDRLINNLDRNLGNQLIDRNWKLWLIDHTRSFGPSDELRTPQAVYWCSERVYQALKTLDEDRVRRELRGLLKSDELRSLFQRWEKMTAHLEALIEKRGREQVLF